MILKLLFITFITAVAAFEEHQIVKRQDFEEIPLDPPAPPVDDYLQARDQAFERGVK